MTVELLTRLNPKANSFIAEMQNTGRVVDAGVHNHNQRMRVVARAKACPNCRGRRRFKVDSITPEGRPTKAWEWCPRCQGSGTLQETGGMSSTRVTKSSVDTITSQDVAAMLAGLPHHKINTALLFVNDDDDLRLWVERYFSQFVVAPNLGAAGVTDVNVCEWMAWLAVAEFRMFEGKRIKARHCAGRINVSTRTWYNVWAARHRANVERLNSWVQEVDVALSGAMDEMRA